jgi:hypothetical protein
VNLTLAIDTRVLRVVGLCIAGAAVLGLAAVSSAHPGPVAGGVIHSCVNATGPAADATAGLIRIVDANTTCKSNERALDWNAQGIQGQKGDKGDTGPQGPHGSQGPQGPAGIATLTTRSKSFQVSPGADAQGIVQCEPGERATGGGISTGPGTKVNTSRPEPLTSTPTGWFVSVSDNSPHGAGFVAWVVCASG